LRGLFEKRNYICTQRSAPFRPLTRAKRPAKTDEKIHSLKLDGVNTKGFPNHALDPITIHGPFRIALCHSNTQSSRFTLVLGCLKRQITGLYTQARPQHTCKRRLICDALLVSKTTAPKPVGHSGPGVRGEQFAEVLD
jgi:hypothetical protein